MAAICEIKSSVTSQPVGIFADLETSEPSKSAYTPGFE